MGEARALAGGRQGGRSGRSTSRRSTTRRRHRPTTTYDVNQSAGKRAQGGDRPERRLLHRRVQLRLQPRSTIPILNQGGAPQVSPANTYVGLTTNDPGSAPGEPQKYYPTGKRTYLRLVPRDSIQGVADLIGMKQAGCTRVAVANDKTAYGAGLALQVQLHASTYGITVTGRHCARPDVAQLPGVRVVDQGAGSELRVHRVQPDRRGGAGQGHQLRRSRRPRSSAATASARAAITNPKMGGFPASIGPLFHCTVATLDLTAYPGGQAFLAAYKAKYGVANPDPYAIYGYEAMKLGLDTISKSRVPRQQQVGGARCAVCDQGPAVGARDLRVRHERRHDADEVRRLQGRPGRQPDVRKGQSASTAHLRSGAVATAPLRG